MNPLAGRAGVRRLLGLVLLLASGTPAFSQKAPAAHAQSTPATLEALAAQLGAGCASDSCRSYRIFEWITRSIAYDVAAYTGRSDPYAPINAALQQQDAGTAGTWYNRQVAELVLRSRKGICDGYARLFLELGRLSGLDVVMIEGCAKVDIIGKPFASNHAWNAVRIAGRWQLLDACWGSGFLDNGRFTRQFNPYYYNTPPEGLIQDHYPDSVRWSLLRLTPEKEAFFSAPKLYPAFQSTGIGGYYPRAGFLQLRQDSMAIFRIIGKDSAVIPDIAYQTGSGRMISLFEHPVPAREFVRNTVSKRPRQAVQATPLRAGKAQRAAVNALMHYADSETAGADEPVAASPESASVPAMDGMAIE